MLNYRINTSIKLDGMDKLKDLLKKQQEILSEFEKNIAEIELVTHNLNVELSMEKATQ